MHQILSRAAAGGLMVLMLGFAPSAFAADDEPVQEPHIVRKVERAELKQEWHADLQALREELKAAFAEAKTACRETDDKAACRAAREALRAEMRTLFGEFREEHKSARRQTKLERAKP
jgi:hypothetical protein